MCFFSYIFMTCLSKRKASRFVQMIFDTLNFVGDSNKKARDYGLMWFEDGKHFFANNMILSAKLNIKANSLNKNFINSNFVSVHYNKNQVSLEFIKKKKKFWIARYHKSGLFYRGSTINFYDNYLCGNTFKINHCICDGAIESVWNTLLCEGNDKFIPKNVFLDKIMKQYYDNMEKIRYYLTYNVFDHNKCIKKSDFILFCRTYGLPQTSKSIFNFLIDDNLDKMRYITITDNFYVDWNIIVEPLKGKSIFKVHTVLDVYYIGILVDSFILCRSFYKLLSFDDFKDVFEEIRRRECIRSPRPIINYKNDSHIYDEFIQVTYLLNERETDIFHVCDDNDDISI